MTPSMTDAIKPPLDLLIAAPRGFCAGVDRAIRIVELALEKHGAPVYVRHEIVHNKFVVDSLKAKGAIFVEELDEVPANAHVVFSAHGVPKSVPADAENRGLAYFDATCPLVSRSTARPSGWSRWAAHRLHRPCRTPRGHRHLRPGAARLDVAGRDGCRCRGVRARRSRQSRLPDPDHPVGRRYRCDDRGVAAPLPDDPGAARRGHLLRHLQPPGRRQGDRRRVRCGAGDRRAQLVQLAASGRSGRAGGQARDADPARRRSRLDVPGRREDAGPDRRSLRARAAGPRTGRPPGERFTVTEREEETTRETIAFKLPRGLETAA